MLRKKISMAAVLFIAAVMTASAQQPAKQKTVAPAKAQSVNRVQLSKTRVAPAPSTSLNKPATTVVAPATRKPAALKTSASKPLPVQADVKVRKPLTEMPAGVKNGRGVITPAGK